MLWTSSSRVSFAFLLSNLSASRAREIRAETDWRCEGNVVSWQSASVHSCPARFTRSRSSRLRVSAPTPNWLLSPKMASAQSSQTSPPESSKSLDIGLFNRLAAVGARCGRRHTQALRYLLALLAVWRWFYPSISSSLREMVGERRGFDVPAFRRDARQLHFKAWSPLVFPRAGVFERRGTSCSSAPSAADQGDAVIQLPRLARPGSCGP